MSATASNWRDRLKLVGAAIALFAGGMYALSVFDAPEIVVACQVVRTVGVSCSVAHRSGGPGRACWNFALTCQNGTRVVASDCARVERGQTVSKLTPAASLPALAVCDAALSSEVTNLRIE